MDKKVTINDIARIAQTSKTTVSFYLSGQFHKMSEETRARIEQAIADTHYIPSASARRLRQSRTHLIGVVVTDPGNVFTSHLIKGVDEIAQAAGCQMIVGSSGYKTENEKELIASMMKLNVDGFVVQPTAGFEAVLEQFSSYDKPFVFMDSPLEDNGYPVVRSNAFQAVRKAMEKMANRGYDRFILIGADPSVLRTRMERMEGFREELEKLDKPYEIRIVSDQVSESEIFEFVSGHLRLNEKTLIFVPNCWLLPVVYQGLGPLRELMPKTIGLLGFDNTEWVSLASPSVSVIVQPGFEEGKNACRILLDQVEKKKTQTVRILPCDLLENRSTAL